MKMSEEEMKTLHNEIVAEAWAEREKWTPMWKRLNDNFFPIVYPGLSKLPRPDDPPIINSVAVDSAPLSALTTLAAGYMNGVTSPARKWLRVGTPVSEVGEDADATPQTATMVQIQTKLLEILAESNYYSTRAVQVYEGAGFGSSLVLCYEDRDTVANFMVCPPGSFAFVVNERNEVVGVVRKFMMRLRDIVSMFGEDAVGKTLAERARQRKGASRTFHTIIHYIEENQDDGHILARTPFRESYWFDGTPPDAPRYLAKRPLYEWPASVFRWDCPGNTTFGVPPTASCLGRAVQLQSNEYKIDQGLDKVVSPPMLAHHSLKNRPKAFHAGGITFSHDLSAGAGARPLLNTVMPFQELDMRRKSIVLGIEDALFTPLFKMISQLETVRSAAEIDARREERLVLLGPVLHRNYKEDLAPLVLRVYGIARRKGLMPELPPETPASITFKNILSDVQKASDVSAVERFFGFTGQVLPAFPEMQQEVDARFLLRTYATGLGIDPRAFKAKEDVDAAMAEQAQMAQLSQVSEIAKNFGAAGQSLGNVDVGGGMNAVQAML